MRVEEGSGEHRLGALRRSAGRAAPALLLGVLLTACTSAPSGPPGSPPVSSTVSLKVMEFNIEYGGEGVDFHSVITAIQAADADVVGIEEAYANMPRIAKDLGWSYYDPRMQLVSRFPLLAPSGGDGLLTYVQVRPGRVVAIGNVHLPSTGYGPFLARNGDKVKDVIAVERRKRLPAVQPSIDALAPVAREGVPTFLVGDFNAPSHLDWTSEAVGTRKQLKYALDWPVSEAVEAAGFHDSYREVHPDPVADPGLTWPASRPFVKGYNPGPNGAPADRIDFVYSAGPATATASELVGEKGGPGVSVVVSPWPTDHRATVSTFEVQPAVPPTLVAVQQRLVAAGEEAHVLFHAPGDGGERVAIMPAGADPTAQVAESPTGDGSPTDGTLDFSTTGWKPGAYEAVLLSASDEALARIPFWVRAPDEGARIQTTRSTYRKGDPIRATWQDAPGNRADWVGIYKRGADPMVAYYILWNYTSGTIEGSMIIDGTAHGPWPLKPGRYSVYLLVDDSYHKVASGDFTVR